MTALEEKSLSTLTNTAGKTSALSRLKPIQSTAYVQWDVYNNVRDAFCPYRNIRVVTPAITRDELIKNMQFDNYVKIVGELPAAAVVEAGAPKKDAKDAKSVGKKAAKTVDNRKIVIAILGRNEKGGNEITSITEKFKLFVNGIKEPNSRIIIISPCKFQTHVLNYIAEAGMGKRINKYTYDHFKVVIPLGPHCSEHEILTPEEAKHELELHHIDSKEMKQIYTYDPQIIWLGAEPNDIVRITRINPLSGRSTDLRRVIRGEAP